MSRTQHPSNRRPFRVGGIFVPAFAGLAAIGVLAWGGSAAFRSATSATSATTLKVKKRDPAPLTDKELAVVLTRLGLEAKPLAAAGLSAQEIGTLVDNARTHLGDHIQDLRDADQNWGTARGERDRLLRLVQGGKTGNVEALETAVSSLATADAARQTVFAAITSAAVDSLDPNKLAVIQTIHGNSGWDMPTQFLAAGREEAAWVHLRDALANQRISVAAGVDPDAGEQAFIGTQSGGAVATAATNLGNLAELNAAWNSAVFH